MIVGLVSVGLVFAVPIAALYWTAVTGDTQRSRRTVHAAAGQVTT